MTYETAAERDARITALRLTLDELEADRARLARKLRRETEEGYLSLPGATRRKITALDRRWHKTVKALR